MARYDEAKTGGLSMFTLWKLFATVILLAAGSAFAQEQAAAPGMSMSPTNRGQARASLIPYPRQAAWHEGEFSHSRIEFHLLENSVEELGQEGELLRVMLSGAGFQWIESEGAQAGPEVRVQLGPVKTSRDKASRDKEAYHMVVSPDRVIITVGARVGLFNAVQTLRQLIQHQKDGAPFIPCCEITDWPAFPFRGFMHDLGRNPQELALLERFVDLMARYKLNVFHMHLTDRPGYRIESKAHPVLNDPKNYRPTRQPGMYYTYAELNRFIDYCRERHVIVIPEIDMPGHSDYFTDTFGFDMQDPRGVAVVHDLVNEFCDHIDLPVIHIGSDEVRIRNESFIPGVYRLLRERGKKVVVWRPGGPIPGDEVVTQLWSRTPEPLEGVQYLDSRASYVNHMDPFTGPVRAFMQQPCSVPERTEEALGGILCHWPDNNVGEEMNIYRQSPVLPALLAYSERIWRGAKRARTDAWAKLPSEDDPAFKEYEEFERDMIVQRERFLQGWPFPYVKQTGIRWRLIGPFPNQGDTTLSFPVEEEIRPSYTVGDASFAWQEADAVGGTINLNHFFGFPGHLPKVKSGTAYGLTYIHSAGDREIDFWIGFIGYSRSSGRQGGPNPELGQWSHGHAKIWVNDDEIAPPRWTRPGLGIDSAEIPFTDEMYHIRAPTKVILKKGWNKVLVKAPRDRTLRKWFFTCVPVQRDGDRIREAEGLTFSTRID